MRLLPTLISLLLAWPNTASVSAASPYQLQTPPLDTPWTSKAPSNPWPQYPRPQLRRDAWKSLNGIWTYQPSTTSSTPDTNSLPSLPLSKEILVPSCIESGISGVMDMSFSVTHMWFGTTFGVPRHWADRGRRVVLNFEAVDYQTTVFVNGVKVGEHTGGYTRFGVDVTDQLKEGENVLHVFVFDPTDDESIPQGKQTKRPSHIFYTPCSGIWQSVWLESVPKNYISSLDLTADMHGEVTVTVHSATQKSTPIEISIAAPHGEVVATQQHVSDKTFTFQVSSPKLWSPDSPTLYNVTVQLGDDEVHSYTGFRTIATGRVNGIQRPLLNGEFVFLFGPLDQGYWPDGIYTPPTPDAMVYDLKVIKGLGFNMVRKHIKVEPDLFYEACDRLGLMVIQDMPSMRVFDNSRASAEQEAEFERQLAVVVDEHKSYTSIVAWVIYNEGWGQFTDGYVLTDRVREWDPTRLVDSTTGWNDFGAGDFSDNHHYAEPQCGTPWSSLPSPPHDSRRIGFQGEYGGIGLRPADENLWPLQGAIDTINQTYELHATAESYHYRAHTLMNLLREQVEKYECSGAVYTQTTDVEGEVNGLMTMDRRVVRVDVDAWKRDIRGVYEAARKRA
ncbi:glycoside hydrolase family 2 protein [Chaetomium sp. MPI-SDFR-AT-0129]|nr:glycoside hydrolase family 2 protein [Chaetomium sp. MPI-SDFR-AT-0129]